MKKINLFKITEKNYNKLIYISTKYINLYPRKEKSIKINWDDFNKTLKCVRCNRIITDRIKFIQDKNILLCYNCFKFLLNCQDCIFYKDKRCYLKNKIKENFKYVYYNKHEKKNYILCLLKTRKKYQYYTNGIKRKVKIKSNQYKLKKNKLYNIYLKS
ncbi:hypothetical protein DRN73_05245 [Candidatus Pacearchaeota archaeon]|nr:MAG: hypothetical protein DRN73_05245 [Candidatus Pacearchaeota archaeon]